MKSIHLCVWLLGLGLSTLAQTDCDCYERLSYLSRYYQKTDQLDSSIWARKQAFSYLPPNQYFAYDYVQLAETYVAKNELDSGFKYAQVAIESGFSLTSLVRYKTLKPLMESDYKDALTSTARKVGPNFNWNYYDALQQLLGIDQSIRRGDQLEPYLDSKTKEQVDAVVFEQVEQLLTQYGYPNFETHGFNDGTLIVFFLHASLSSEEQYQRILTYLETAHQSCYTQRSNVAAIRDRRTAWYHDKPQPTGMFNHIDRFAPIADLTQVDELRFQYNLLSLADEAKVKGFELPEGYIQKDYPKGYFCTNRSSRK